MNSKLNSPIAPWPYFAENEKQASLEVLNSGKVNYWTGSVCRDFEKEFASYAGRKFGIALANGSLALELALIAYDIGPGDEVIVTCRSFMASASCIIMRGATPVFADIDLDSQDILPESIEKKITSKTKAIICVHLAGWPCDMDKINNIAKKHNLKVIEDCAQAHGAKYNNKPVGSLGDVAAFSFCQDKIMTCGGEGGMFVCDDEEIYKKCWSYTEHGKSLDALARTDHPIGFHWLIESFGTNWRMTEMQAAIGHYQLQKLNKWVETRRANAFKLTKALKDIKSIRIPEPNSNIYHSYYKYYIMVIPEMLKEGYDRNRILTEICSTGLSCGVGACGELYQEKAFKKYFKTDNPERFPNAVKIADTSLMFQVHPTLTEQNIDDAINIIREVLLQATK